MSSTIRHAVRRLLRERTLTITAVLTLALGIGATTAVFTVVNAVLLQPLAYPRPERLVDLSHTLTISGITRVDQSDATFLYYARENRVFSGIGAYRVTGVNIAGSVGGSTTVDARAERLSAGLVSASTFSVLGAVPILGRTFRDNEDGRDAPRVALLGQRLWERKFGADRGIIGRQISIDGVPREIVGIMTNHSLGMRTAAWVAAAPKNAHGRSTHTWCNPRYAMSLGCAARAVASRLPLAASLSRRPTGLRRLKDSARDRGRQPPDRRNTCYWSATSCTANPGKRAPWSRNFRPFRSSARRWASARCA